MPIASLLGVRADFDERKLEVENYFRCVADLAEERWFISANPSKGGVLATADENELLMKTFKASCFLLLYNLVEATTKNSVQAIYDEFKLHGTTYDQCRNEIKRIAIKNIKREKLGIDEIYVRLGIVAEHIMTEPFSKDSLLSGNVDANSLKNLAKEYGFHAPGSRCDKFKDVKENRNYLAHGNKTFNEVGRDYAVGDLILIKDQVIRFLGKFIENVEDYLTNQLYLAVPPGVIPAASPVSAGVGVGTV